MTALSNEEAFAELWYSRKAIKDLLGVTTQCWWVLTSDHSQDRLVSHSHWLICALTRRPPYGDVDNRIRTIAQALNLTTIIWSYDTVSQAWYGAVGWQPCLILCGLWSIVWSKGLTWAARQFDWEEGTNGVTSATVDSNYQGIIDRASNGTFATHGPVVLNHELSTSLTPHVTFLPDSITDRQLTAHD
jgi:hypothetical protein